MKVSRVLVLSFAVLTCGAWGVGQACDHDKTQTSATSASTAGMKSGSASMDCCASGHKTTATSASTASTASAASAASMEGCSAHKGTSATSASMEACSAHKGVSATAAGMEGCSAHKGTSATSASAASSCSAHKDASAAMAGGMCKHGDATSAMAEKGSACNGKGMTTAAGMSAHSDCEACADMKVCAEELEAAGAHTQIVPLKNGVMFVYTADSPGQVRAVQAAMVRRGERINQFVAAGDKAHLCAECKTIRGAMASGKLNREVVKIEGGSLTLMTSDDPKMVAKIHNMVDVRMAARTKS